MRAAPPVDATSLDYPYEMAKLIDDVCGRRKTAYERFVKVALDWTAALLLVVVMLPVLAATALLVLMTLASPVLIRQSRVGRDGRVFDMFKFRTMRPDRRRGPDPSYTGVERRLTHKSANDPRHTQFGQRLRRLSLDELPQLFNVLRGEMSLIGPRPELSNVVDTHYRGWQRMRHLVKPGITGYWQVTERANGTLLHERVDLDIAYIANMSLRNDLRILWQTPEALMRRDRVH